MRCPLLEYILQTRWYRKPPLPTQIPQSSRGSAESNGDCHRDSIDSDDEHLPGSTASNAWPQYRSLDRMCGRQYVPQAQGTVKTNLICCMMCTLVMVFLVMPASFFLTVARRPTRHITPITLDRMSLAAPPMFDKVAFTTVLGFCHKYQFGPYLSGITAHRKIYDVFSISDELDWLEIRLNTLSAHVDYFVIVESNETSTGLPKPLYLKENWSRFAWFHSKIIYRTVEGPETGLDMSTEARETFMRNALLYSTFPTLMFTDKEAKEGDIILIGKVDEIPKPDTLTILRHCNVPDRVTLRSYFYQNSFQWLHTGEQWAHPQATVFHGLQKTISPSNLRNGTGGSKTLWRKIVDVWFQRKVELWDAAWYCRSCSNETAMEKEDLTGEEGDLFTRIENNTDVPSFVLDDPRRFGYMLD